MLGRSVKLDAQTLTVVGVMPPHFGFWGGEIYTPFCLDPNDRRRSDCHLWALFLLCRDTGVERAERDHLATKRAAPTSSAWCSARARASPLPAWAPAGRRRP